MYLTYCQVCVVIGKEGGYGGRMGEIRIYTLPPNYILFLYPGNTLLAKISIICYNSGNGY